MPKKEYEDLMPEELAKYDNFPFAKENEGIRMMAYMADISNMTNLELKEYYESLKEENKGNKENVDTPEYLKEVTPIIKECKTAKKSVTLINDFVDPYEINCFIFAKKGVELNIISDNTGNQINEMCIFSFEQTHPNLKLHFKHNHKLFHGKYLIIDYGTADEKVFLYDTANKKGENGDRIFTSLYNGSDFDHRVSQALEFNEELKLK